MIKALLIEDEAPAAQRLSKLLVELRPEIKILNTLDSIEQSVEWLIVNPSPELIFLDIQLADGLSFDIFQEVPCKSFVIFTTAYDEYALKAFDINSIDYLLKPINIERLEKALIKFEQIRGKAPDVDFNSLAQLLATKTANYKKRFIISVGNRIKSVETAQICMFYTLNKNTFLMDSQGKSYPVDFSLDNLENLVNPEQFFRVNRQNLVNYSHIENINILSKSRLQIILSPHTEPVLVSSLKTTGFKNWLDK